ncbi:AIPR family protein [Blastopirellula marina]|uniref:AIPR protein n=1 Tax=Blastopirellula marina TaxID=124 RepID=A0A2S8F3D4_9BACT|nr:AIPR family protein [Blastopirellula marina]PQO26661.1 AIPR protein [Blastopirellula marina]PTL40972.1 AIPR protein [Blastopirellula marina]
MDKITNNLVKKFLENETITPKDESEAFEHFANFAVIANEYSETFDVTDIHAGSAADTGLDGVAILVNGSLVTDEEEIEDLAKRNNYLDVTFVFIQGKTSSSFDSSEFGNFAFGVKDFFSDEPSLVRNARIEYFSSLERKVFEHSSSMTKGKPECKLFYVTTGTWNGDKNFEARIKEAKRDLNALNLFREVQVTPVDADSLHELYNATQNKVSTDVQFPNKITLPDINGVQQAYLGVLPANEYLKLITDSSGGIRKSLFYDNVRDYQGENVVNREIGETFSLGYTDRFAILNNGVTIVAKHVNVVGNKFHIEDYQIVNGCQTSHVLFHHADDITAQTHVPVKVIVTDNEEVMHSVVKATNRQTAVSIEALESLSAYQKKLERYYDAMDPHLKLYYERRSRQYAGAGVEKTRIVTLSNQLRYFASMFLNEPHRAGRYYSTLLKMIGQRVFLDGHDPVIYYTSAFVHYKMESLFRNGFLEPSCKLFRYHISMVLRLQIGGEDMPKLTHAKKIRTYCEKILAPLKDSTKAVDVFKDAIDTIESITTGAETRDTVKTQSFTDKVLEAI